MLAYSNSSARGWAFLKRLSDLSTRGTLFVPQNSGLRENEVSGVPGVWAVDKHPSTGSGPYHHDDAVPQLPPKLSGYAFTELTQLQVSWQSLRPWAGTLTWTGWQGFCSPRLSRSSRLARACSHGCWQWSEQAQSYQHFSRPCPVTGANMPLAQEVTWLGLKS